jgi:RNA polymerase sigma-70 factor (ECF subfamily)
MSERGLTRERQAILHERILRDDPVAFAELCELALPQLISFLEAQFPQHDAHLHETTAIDSLLAYRKKSKQFDSQRLPLFAYLRMAVRRDMLNAIDKMKRHEQRLISIDAPVAQSHLIAQAENDDFLDLDEWLFQHTDLSSQQILAALDSELSAMDREILYLMLDGVRERERFVAVMGIGQKDGLEQRREVKRAKDRILKKLRRFGRRMERA